MAPARPTSRRRWALGALAAFVATLGWTTAALLDGGGELHDAPVMVVGPSVVTSALVDRADDLPGHPIQLGNTADPAVAEALLESNDVLAVLTLDLTGTEDTLALNPRSDPRRDRALVERIAQLESGQGRSIAVRRNGAAWDVDTVRGPSAVALGFLATAAGFLVALGISLRWGAVAPGWRRAVVRLAVVTGSGGVVGLAASLLRPAGIPAGEAALALAAAAVGGALITLACEALDGLRGLLLGAVVVLGLPLPLVVAGAPDLLAEPWSTLTSWSIGGAAGAGLVAGTGQTGSVLPTLVLAGAIGLALLVLVTRRVALDGGRDVVPEAPAGAGSPTPAPLRRELAALAVSTIVVAAAVYYGWAAGLDSDPPTSVAARAASSVCRPTGPVTSVRDLNAITRLRGSPQMRGGDVGASARLQDGRHIWLFGDTLRDGDVAGGGFVRNSMLITGDDCLSVVVPADSGAVIPDRDATVGYWPMSVAVAEQQGYDLVAVTAQRVRTVDPDDVFGFENLGPAVAVFVVPSGGTPQLVSVTDVGGDDPDPSRPAWGAATSLSDGWLYLYGTARPADAALATGFSLRVARVRPYDVRTTAAWRYWDGSAWVRQADAAAELIPAEGGVSQTLSVFEGDGTWYAVSKRNEFLGEDLVVWTAPAPTGPFTAQPPVASLPSDASTGELRYMPLAHPELLPRRRSVVVSYSRNRARADEIIEDPSRYRIRFLRVPLPRG